MTSTAMITELLSRNSDERLKTLFCKKSNDYLKTLAWLTSGDYQYDEDLREMSVTIEPRKVCVKTIKARRSIQDYKDYETDCLQLSVVAMEDLQSVSRQMKTHASDRKGDNLL